MANVIKHKRGSGSDPAASDLVVGEVAIRTDVGKLFTKMDNGSVAEIAGGGSDIAINTLSSSSATGGGSATFNGSAYRFTLSQPPSVSAYQLLVSINGVIQKPVAGTGQPSEGFSVDGTDIILGDAPATGADFFILTFKSLGVSEPADNSVTSAKIVDGAIVNADINASAAIAGSKIADFVSNNANNRVLTATGTANSFNGETNLTFSGSSLIQSGNHVLKNQITDSSGLKISQEANDVSQIFNHYAGAMTFGVNNAEKMRIDSSGRVGIGCTPTAQFNHNLIQIGNQATLGANAALSSTGQTFLTHNLYYDTGGTLKVFNTSNANEGAIIQIREAYFAFSNSAATTGTPTVTERFRIDSSGNVGIGTTSPATLLNLNVDTEANLGSGSKGIRLTSGSSNAQFVRLGSSYSNGSVTGPGTLVYSSNKLSLRCDNGNPITFHTGSTVAERMRIDSSGNVGINTTAPVEKIGVAGNMRFVNPTGTTRRIIALPSGGYTVGTSGGSAIAFHRISDGGGGSDEIAFETHWQGNRHSESARISKFGGITFNGDTAAANALDDYEEGTWTPVVGGWDTFTPYSGSSYYLGWYTKVGTLVHCGWKIYIQSLSTVSSSAQITIQGLPFNSSSVHAGIVAHVRFDIPEFGFEGYPLGYLAGSSNLIYMNKHIDGGNHLVSIDATANRSNVWTMGTATYQTA